MFPHPEMNDLEDALRQSRPVTQPLPPGVKQRLRAQLLEKTHMKTSIFLINRLASAVVGLVLTILLPAVFMFGSFPSFGTTPPASGPIFGELFQLLSHNTPTPVAVNQSFGVQLVWMAVRPPNQDYTISLQLLDENQQVVAQTDQLLDTANWPPQQPQEITIGLVAPAEPGRYLLMVGWSDPQPATPLTLDTQQTTWLLGELEVVLDGSTATPLPTRPTEEPPTETATPLPTLTPPNQGTATPLPTRTMPPGQLTPTPPPNWPTATPGNPGQHTPTPPAWPTATPGNPGENTPTPPPNWPTATPGNPGENTPTPPPNWPTATPLPTRTPPNPGENTPTPPPNWPTATPLPTRTPPPNNPTATPGNPGENTPTPPAWPTPTLVPTDTPPGQFTPTPTPPPNWPTATPGNPGENTPTPIPTQTMPPGQFTPTPTPPNSPPSGGTPTPTRQP